MGDTFGSVINFRDLYIDRESELFTSTFSDNVYTVAITLNNQRGNFMFKAASANTGATQISDGVSTVQLLSDTGALLVAGIP